MKLPLKTHKESLVNLGNSIARYETDVEQLQLRIKQVKNEWMLLARQVERAEKEGKTEFDRDRFDIPRTSLT